MNQTSARQNLERKRVTLTVHFEFDLTDSLAIAEKKDGPIDDIAQWAIDQFDGYDFNDNVVSMMDVTHSAATDTQYVESQGNQCPFCFEETVSTEDDIETDYDYLTREASCDTCKRTWKDDYRLHGYIAQD